jgi:hypothetical protein
MSTSYEIIAPVAKRLFANIKDDDEKDDDENLVKLREIIQLLPQVFDWETVKEVSREILPGTVVADEETSATIGDDGFSPLAAGDPIEQFTTIFYCICANFPKYISFLGVALDTPDDSTEGPVDDSQTTH